MLSIAQRDPNPRIQNYLSHPYTRTQTDPKSDSLFLLNVMQTQYKQNIYQKILIHMSSMKKKQSTREKQSQTQEREAKTHFSFAYRKIVLIMLS